MHFKGDIIITDPCYIMRKNPHPFVSLQELGVGSDILCKNPAKLTEEEKTILELLNNTPYKQWERENDDWQKCDYGRDMEVLGFTSYISKTILCSFIRGDWSCTTYSTETDPKELLNKLYSIENQNTFRNERETLYNKVEENFKNVKKIGHFCADAGMVAIFLLDEVLKYNPDFNYHIERPWVTTLIRDFDGDVEYYVDSLGNAHITGKVILISLQTQHNYESTRSY